MATAGERYEERTGNIWSYAHRGDMSGLRAALARGVSPDMINTVGWSPCHAAAAGGHTKALRLLVKSGADLEIADRGGNLPVHQAAKNGHMHALRVLGELGADMTKVRLSQTKGKAVRDLVIEAYRNAGVANSEEEEAENAPAVGYARRQAKSTAFWGPRRTPISTKIKKKIIKEKRVKRKEKKEFVRNDTEQVDKQLHCGEYNPEETLLLNTRCEELSHVETVRKVKRERKLRQRQKQGRKHNSQQHVDENNMDGKESCDMSIIIDGSEGEDQKNDCLEVNGFAALSLLEESDGENDED
mmetsp:Transcript_21559/g.46893  ORF Transcript_21559/g.46893 Transcript_21559/m.46893 type:complete len:300 (+) Transcript_21559:195-1094(+)|eukprot:CAMPEP_0172297902 /NCGR_PEP_ID=MMETSP1058-20130122/770_1 /TAXON_ID=83371 /ORGANISM="Detonula confervacea, Strain CCMP 353" /LENGTH=299 /DNA_ID=CAMNT_0013007119 /DNA_START=130 /DNA_END=1029 /DNA_ORIENTATION=-